MKYYDPASTPKHKKHHGTLDHYTTTLKQQFGLSLPSANLVLHSENYVFSGKCSIFTNLDYGIKFTNCYFTQRLSFDRVEIKGTLQFTDCYFEEGIEIRHPQNILERGVDFIGCYVNGNVSVRDGQFKSSCSWSFKDFPRLLIQDGEYKQLNIGLYGGNEIKELLLDVAAVKGEIRITGSQSKINSVNIRGTSPDLNLILEYFSCNELYFYRYRNGKGLSVSKITPISFGGSKLGLIESSFGKAEFFSLNFQLFEQVYFSDVNVIESSFISIIWPKNIKSVNPPSIASTTTERDMERLILKLENPQLYAHLNQHDLKNNPLVIDYYRRKREILRQLKFAMSKQGDIINEQIFHGEEMISYNRTLKLSDFFWTKLIIKFSKMFGEFGQDYKKPLFFMLIGHWILLMILILGGQFGNLYLSFKCANCAEGFKTAFEQYFKLINPLRKPDDTFSGYFVIVDIFMRIWVSYMIYNIIRATRRFIK